MFFKKSVLKKFANFRRKHLCHRLFLIKLQDDACNFIKKETPILVFSCEFFEIFRIYFLKNISQRLLLTSLTLSRRRSISYRNQSIDLLRKSMDWFLYDIDLRRERVKPQYQKHDLQPKLFQNVLKAI